MDQAVIDTHWVKYHQLLIKIIIKKKYLSDVKQKLTSTSLITLKPDLTPAPHELPRNVIWA